MEIIIYFLKLSFVLTGLYFVWYISGKRKTDPFFDRIFMLIAPFLAIIIPLIHFEIQLKSSFIKNFENLPEIEMAMSYFSGEETINSPQNLSFLTFFHLIKWTYIIIGAILLFQTLHSIYLKIQLIKKYGITKDEKLKLVSVRQKILPFSFINYVFLNPHDYDSDSLNVILKHEKAHIRQYHFADVIFYEFLRIFLWFHPVYWIMKRKLSESHEYLADRFVLESGVDRLKYMNLILSHINYNYSSLIGSSFSKIITIKRLKMMKTHDKIKNMPRIAFSLVSIILLLVLMSFNTSDTNKSVSINISSLSKAAPSPPSISPVDISKVTMTSGFGMRIHPITKKEVLHKGIDLAAPLGTDVVASADGVVADAGYDPKGAGRFITIKHDETYTTFYSQLDEVLVEVNQEVKKGGLIGKVGSSGLSTGPHLHYEVRIENTAVDPEGYLGK
ncbi:MAG: peptidoglycan DD-metalloendopeptidase family protein [Bacteroidales bacterium]|nr:peptidoglycan DD-metalloendopeptidase family protein [Bacteroidales bacterium]MCF8390507.1 peptidoglycan DD-metalloendopeptidase family protein [Bacteroidales bacterium]